MLDPNPRKLIAKMHLLNLSCSYQLVPQIESAIRAHRFLLLPCQKNSRHGTYSRLSSNNFQKVLQAQILDAFCFQDALL